MSLPNELGFKDPEWYDYQNFWEQSSHEERLKYAAEAFGDTEDNPVVIAVAKQHWEGMPEMVRELIWGGQFGNDVFNFVNDEP
jgi:hypothetical protein